MAQIMRNRLKTAAIALLVTAAGSGCIVEDHHREIVGPIGTDIEFAELRNLGYPCGGPLTEWTVQNRQTGDKGTAGCEQSIFFESIAPGHTYTFDVAGYRGQELCWQGSCDVLVPSTGRTVADCSGQISHLCGL